MRIREQLREGRPRASGPMGARALRSNRQWNVVLPDLLNSAAIQDSRPIEISRASDRRQQPIQRR